MCVRVGEMDSENVQLAGMTSGSSSAIIIVFLICFVLQFILAR